MTQVPTLRPMGLLQIIDRTFRLYRSNFWLFFGMSAIVYLPVGFLQGVLGQRGQLVAVPLLLIAYPLVLGAITKAVSDRYMGEAATVAGSYRYVFKRLIPFVLTLTVSFLLVLGGVVLLVVGAIVFSFWVAFVSEIFIIEDKRYFAAIWRSKFLIGKGVWVQVAVLGFITAIIAYSIQLPLQLPGMLLALLTDKHSLIASFLLGIGSGLGQALAQPIGLVASILLYYDSRIRKEGFDLEVLARELGTQLPPQPPPASPQPPPPPSSPPPPYPPPGEGRL